MSSTCKRSPFLSYLYGQLVYTKDKSRARGWMNYPLNGLFLHSCKSFHNVVREERLQDDATSDWQNIEFVREYLQRLQQHYHITGDEWHLITTGQINDFQGAGLLKQYKTLRNALQVAFPELSTSVRPRQNWKDIEYVRDYLKRLRLFYHKTDSEWHLITNKQIVEFNGHGLLKRYKTLSNAVKLAFPDVTVNTKFRQNWRDVEYVKEYLKKVQLHYGIAESEWRLITIKQIVAFNGRGLLDRYKTLQNAIQFAYPGINTGIQPLQDWKDIKYVTEYLHRLRSHYQISDDEWHLISNRQILDYNGAGLLKRYKTLSNALQVAFPDIKLTVARHNWQDLEYVRKYLHRLRAHYRKSENEWHLITNKDILAFNGGGLLSRYKTFHNVIQQAFPGAESSIRPRQNWEDLDYVRDYLERLRLYYQIPEGEWQTITNRQIEDYHGRGLLKRYKTFHNALRQAFPGIEIAPRSDWSKRANVIKLLEEIKKELGITHDTELLNVSAAKMKQYGAGPAIAYHKTKGKLLQFVYPQCSPKEVKSRNFWNNTENIKAFMKEVEQKLFIRKPQDWYRVSDKQIRYLGGNGLLSPSRKMDYILSVSYPDIKWDKALLLHSSKKSEQFYLRNMLSQIFPNSEIIEDYLHPELTFTSGKSMEIDLFIPAKNIAVEYQGEHHYIDSPAFGPIELYQQRDQQKEQKCIELGIHFVAVPYWWSRTVEDLQQRINTVIKN